MAGDSRFVTNGILDYALLWTYYALVGGFWTHLPPSMVTISVTIDGTWDYAFVRSEYGYVARDYASLWGVYPPATRRGRRPSPSRSPGAPPEAWSRHTHAVTPPDDLYKTRSASSLFPDTNGTSLEYTDQPLLGSGVMTTHGDDENDDYLPLPTCSSSRRDRTSAWQGQKELDGAGAHITNRLRRRHRRHAHGQMMMIMTMMMITINVSPPHLQFISQK
jgi:hypothetical protein